MPCLPRESRLMLARRLAVTHKPLKLLKIKAASMLGRILRARPIESAFTLRSQALTRCRIWLRTFQSSLAFWQKPVDETVLNQKPYRGAIP